MNYTVLARKYRPQRFEDVVGQGHVTKSLMNALSMGRVAHAFLFSGTRGVGKTTTARVLAKALNCETGPTPAPCGECDSCREITQGSSVDVMEIDAASNTGVDNVRELRENVKYAPARGRYKVYIIDEVHMLSGAAFNALLKTLEEPPPHVVFILATTDPHKLPATILSRCQHYDFRRVPKAAIQAHLRSLCDAEGINAEEGALVRLSALAEGSVRDSLSLMDQVISFCGEGGVREADIDETLGLVGRAAVREAAEAVISQDPARAFELVDSLVDKGHDLRRFAAELMGFFRDLLVCRISKKPERALDLPAPDVAEYREMAKRIHPEELIRLLNLLTRTVEEIKDAANKRITLELALVKAASRPIGSVEDVIKGVKGLKEGGYIRSTAESSGRVMSVPDGCEIIAAKRDSDAEAYYRNPGEPSKPAGELSAVDLWDRIREEIKKSGKAPLAAKMKVAAPKELNNNILSVSESTLPFKPEELEAIKGAAQDLGGFKIKVINGSGKEKTLADHKKEKEHSRKEKMRQEALSDPLVKAAVDLFGAEIVEVEDSKT
ncbi:MAG: DNA polymerase III subunit gamma/tau [Nitrospirota bacterium]